jgi:hypothetical protein
LFHVFRVFRGYVSKLNTEHTENTEQEKRKPGMHEERIDWVREIATFLYNLSSRLQGF